MKILILKPSSLGDVIQALPVARLLKRRFPEAEIHWWLNRDLVPLLEADPDLARVIPFDRKRWGSPLGWPAAVASVLALRRERYDWVIDLQSLLRSGVVAWLANGAFTVGLEDRREGAPAFYQRAVPRRSYDTHAVDWYLDVVRALDVPVDFDFDWLPVNRAAAQVVNSLWPDDGSRWIALQPGARWLNKRWPAESFGDLAAALVRERPDVRLAILGGDDDRRMGEVIAARAGGRALNLCGELTLPGMVEMLRRCTLMVTNDTGPMHVAAALGKPVIGLFGPTTPTRTGPYGQAANALQATLPCVPCMKSTCANAEPLACLKAISAAQVQAAVLARLPA